MAVERDSVEIAEFLREFLKEAGVMVWDSGTF